MSAIYIKDLMVAGRHGVHQIEKQRTQRFCVSVELLFDLTAAAASDDLNDTMNYSTMRQTIINVVQNTSFNLMERLAQAIADELFAHYEQLGQIVVSIDKPDIYDTGTPGVRLAVNRQGPRLV